MQSDKNDLLKIRKLKVKNFRCFEEREFEFDDEFTVLIGGNGAGKTAVLDALAKCLALAMAETHVEHGGAYVGVPDVRRETIPTEPMSQMEPRYPVELGITAVTEGCVTSLRETLMAADAPIDGTRGGLALFQRTGGGEALLPLVAYYGEARYSASRSGTADGFVGQQPRTHGYVGCLASAASTQYMLRWMKQVEVVRLQEEKEVPALDMVKAAIKACVPELRDLRYRVRDDELTVDLAGGRTLPFRMLPSGRRSVLAMVADMVWRCSFLNPPLGADAARETPGVVLIDEIDLHLHPKWQQTIVDDLRRTFPKVQFIATTHSPFIIQSLREGELLALDGATGEDYFGRGVEDIAELVMAVPQAHRSKRYVEMMAAARDYYRYLEQAEGGDPAKRQELKAKLDGILEQFSDNPAYVAFLEMKRAAAGLGDGKE